MSNTFFLALSGNELTPLFINLIANVILDKFELQASSILGQFPYLSQHDPLSLQLV